MSQPTPVEPDFEPASFWHSPLPWIVLIIVVLGGLMLLVESLDAAPVLPVLGQLPAYTLTSAQGDPFGSTDLQGHTYVANFFFTRCITICPRLTAAMARLDRRIADAGVAGVHLISISVDPTYDTPERLAEYARAHGIDPERWTLLTGPEDEVENLVVGGFKTAIGEPISLGAGLIDIAHSAKIVLVDGSGTIRGYYSSDEDGLDQAFADVTVLAQASRSRR